jgi:phosphonatase-like hydrolase
MGVIKQTKLAIFDVAGTTAKDDGLVVKAFQLGIATLGVEMGSPEMTKMTEYVNATMGERKMDVFLHLLNGDKMKANMVHDKFISSYIRLIKDGELEEFDGITPFFVDLRSKNIGIAITTGFPREILDVIIDSLNWRRIIDVSVAASEVSHGRPAPDMIFKALQEFSIPKGENLTPAEIAVIGDTKSDMQSGVTAGAQFIVGVTSGAHTKDELFEAGATSVIDLATQLLTVVN